MSKKFCLLNNLNSKYILEEILSCAYRDIKSVLQLIKYNKSLMKKLDINNKRIFKKDEYKYYVRIEKNGKECYYISLFKDIIFSLLLLIYIIIYFVKRKFNDTILKQGYNKRKKTFIDFMDNYILLVYFGFIIVSNFINFLFMIYKNIYIKRIFKTILLLFICFVDLTHYICYIIKFVYSKNILKEDIVKNLKKKKNINKEIKKLIWFYDFDITIIVFLSLFMFFSLIINFIAFNDIKDRKYLYLNQINRINIDEHMLPNGFENLNEKEKKEYVFKKENIKKYVCYLVENQRNFIDKINEIRKQKNIPSLIFELFQKLPDFIINEKTVLIFYPNKNIYKLDSFSYLFKFTKNEFENFINKTEVLNIITNDLLDRINIIEINNLEYVSIYKNKITINNDKCPDTNPIEIQSSDISESRIENPIINNELPKIEINFTNYIENNDFLDIPNTTDKFEEKSETISQISEKKDLKTV